MIHSADIRVMGAHQPGSGAWGHPIGKMDSGGRIWGRYGLDFVALGVMRQAVKRPLLHQKRKLFWTARTSGFSQ